MTTEADFTLLVVKTPPVSHGYAEWITHRSSRCPLGMADAPVVKALMPHAAVPARTLEVEGAGGKDAPGHGHQVRNEGQSTSPPRGEVGAKRRVGRSEPR